MKKYEAYLKEKKISFIEVIPKDFSKDTDEEKIVGIDFYSNIRGANIESFKELINQYTMKLYRIRETVVLT